jgi:hypothetical protein
MIEGDEEEEPFAYVCTTQVNYVESCDGTERYWEAILPDDFGAESEIGDGDWVEMRIRKYGFQP